MTSPEARKALLPEVTIDALATTPAGPEEWGEALREAAFALLDFLPVYVPGAMFKGPFVEAADRLRLALAATLAPEADTAEARAAETPRPFQRWVRGAPVSSPAPDTGAEERLRTALDEARMCDLSPRLCASCAERLLREAEGALAEPEPPECTCGSVRGERHSKWCDLRSSSGGSVDEVKR